MNVNRAVKYITFFFACIFIILCAPFFVCAEPINNSELLKKINAAPECAKIKKRITAAYELYAVENKILKTSIIQINDIVAARYLNYEFVCPKGGRYSFDNKMNVICSRCDAKEPPNDQNKSAEIGIEKKIKPDATLESKINKYLDKEDMNFLKGNTDANFNQKKDADTSEALAGPNVIIKDSSETALSIDDKKTDPESSDEASDDASATEQISLKDNSSAGKGAKDFHKEAIEHAQRGEIDNAIEKFQKAIGLVPDSFTYHYNYGLFLAKTESYDLAYIEFQRALRLDPQNKKVKQMIEKLKKAISSK